MLIGTSSRRRLPAALVLAGLLLAGVTGARAAAGTRYETGFRNVTNISADLFLALDSKQRQKVSPTTLLLAGVRLPCIASQPGGAGSSPGEPVKVSSGFIDFINQVAHAKAIDESERGFFVRYTRQVAMETRHSLVPDFDLPPSPSAQNFQTMNRQASHFNQMVGGLVAIDLAHQYLGHYSKHAAEFPSQSAFPMPVNTLITEPEWRTAVLRGAHNALACGLGTDGLRAVFECFEKMPARPAWAAYFIHPEANVTKMNAELRLLERDFFAMNQQLKKAGS